jgi:hypothetical protein
VARLVAPYDRLLARQTLGNAPLRQQSPRLMYYLYGDKPGKPRKLVATFDGEQQLLAYVRWATLSEANGVFKFEQGSSLASYSGWSYSNNPAGDEDAGEVDHNPTPSML